MDKPLADSIEGIPLVFEQANNVRTTRSTVGTITEINDYLKLLFPRIAKGFCPSCKREVKPESRTSIVTDILRQFDKQIVLITFGVKAPPGTKQKDFFEFLQGQGFLRVWLNNQMVLYR